MDKKTFDMLVCIACGFPIRMHRDECNRYIGCERLFKRYLPVPTIVAAQPSQKKIRLRRKKGKNGK